jgi:hypothetical protein
VRQVDIEYNHRRTQCGLEINVSLPGFSRGCIHVGIQRSIHEGHN